MLDTASAGLDIEAIVSKKIDNIKSAKARSKSKTRARAKKEKRETTSKRRQEPCDDTRDAAPACTPLLREQAAEKRSARKSRSVAKKKPGSESVSAASTKGRSDSAATAKEPSRSRKLARSKQKLQRSKSSSVRNGRSFHSQMAAQSRAHSVTKRSRPGVGGSDASVMSRMTKSSLSSRLTRTSARSMSTKAGGSSTVENLTGKDKSIMSTATSKGTLLSILSLSQRLGRTINIKINTDQVHTKEAADKTNSTIVRTEEGQNEKIEANDKLKEEVANATSAAHKEADKEEEDVEKVPESLGDELDAAKEDSKVVIVEETQGKADGEVLDETLDTMAGSTIANTISNFVVGSLGTSEHHRASKALLESPTCAPLEPFQVGDKYDNIDKEREEDKKMDQLVNKTWKELYEKNSREKSAEVGRMLVTQSADFSESDPSNDGLLTGFDKFLNLFCDIGFTGDIMHIASEVSLEGNESYPLTSSMDSMQERPTEEESLSSYHTADSKALASR